MPRPYWKGYLRVSLVSCPVSLFTATTGRERISFHLLNPKTHNRIQNRTVDPDTGKEVPREELVRGYEFEKGRYVIVEKEELDALKIESSETIDLTRFVDARSITPVYMASPYYLAPQGKLGTETFRVLHQAMANKKVVGIGRLVLATHEHAVAVSPYEGGMLVSTLRPANEVKGAAEFFEEIDGGHLDREMVQLAERILEQRAGKFDPEEFEQDRYQAALHELVAQKIRGEKPVIPKVAARPSNVVNLMDALKRSLEEEEGAKPAAPSRRRATQREHAEAAHAGSKPRRKKRASN